ncbi:hypothetical protein L596_014064 [Steinernema carpocapsae]|uniref:MADF domain-containing protein n=1 Tax=Steinernema carpocapsae TaxID=34508 RepID=A0A4U5NBB6_STECR|nr:hypothetical protein L596_014064 [Steinernema carpocapsae]
MGNRKPPSLVGVCGHESVTFLIQLVKKRPALYTVSTSFPSALHGQQQILFAEVMDELKKTYPSAELTEHMVWRCWYNLRSTFMRGSSSRRWDGQLDFLRERCGDELKRKRMSSRASSVDRTDPYKRRKPDHQVYSPGHFQEFDSDLDDATEDTPSGRNQSSSGTRETTFSGLGHRLGDPRTEVLAVTSLPEAAVMQRPAAPAIPPSVTVRPSEPIIDKPAVTQVVSIGRETEIPPSIPTSPPKLISETVRKAVLPQSTVNNFHENQFNQYWTQIEKSDGSEARINKIRSEIVNIIDDICDQFDQFELKGLC